MQGYTGKWKDVFVLLFCSDNKFIEQAVGVPDQ